MENNSESDLAFASNSFFLKTYP